MSAAGLARGPGSGISDQKQTWAWSHQALGAEKREWLTDLPGPFSGLTRCCTAQRSSDNPTLALLSWTRVFLCSVAGIHTQQQTDMVPTEMCGGPWEVAEGVLPTPLILKLAKNPKLWFNLGNCHNLHHSKSKDAQ